MGALLQGMRVGAVAGVSNFHTNAAMSGQSHAEFKKTRNVPGARYSVAGREAGALVRDARGKQRPR